MWLKREDLFPLNVSRQKKHCLEKSVCSRSCRFTSKIVSYQKKNKQILFVVFEGFYANFVQQTNRLFQSLFRNSLSSGRAGVNM